MKNVRIRARRGVAAVYMAMALVVLMGFAAFAIDVGRGYMARQQLQTAADAAALAAVWEVPTDLTTAKIRATNIAAANSCQGTPVALQASDIKFGFWDKTKRTFTELTGNALVGANAVQVTAKRVGANGVAMPFGGALGRPMSDVSATAVASDTGGIYVPYGIIGLSGVSMNGKPLVDSYNSANGPYSPASAGKNGSVGSNGNINIVGNTTVEGNLYPGPGMTAGTPKTFGGTIIPLTDLMYFPPVNAAPYATANNDASLPTKNYNSTTHDFTVGAQDTVALAPGTYYFHNFTEVGGGSITVSGPTTIYITGDTSLAGNVTGGGNIPANFQLDVQGTGSVSLTGTSDLYAAIYAPQATLNVNGTADFFGAMIAGTISGISGNAAIHVDTSLTTLGPRQVGLVK